MQILDSLKSFWTLISTPGTQLPIGTTIGVMVVIALCTFLMPAFAQWVAYRRQNPMEDPREKFKSKAAAKSASKSNSSGKKSSKKKKKH